MCNIQDIKHHLTAATACLAEQLGCSERSSLQVMLSFGSANKPNSSTERINTLEIVITLKFKSFLLLSHINTERLGFQNIEDFILFSLFYSKPDHMVFTVFGLQFFCFFFAI